jgi:hypothetical protein
LLPPLPMTHLARRDSLFTAAVIAEIAYMADYIPRADAKALDWFRAFKEGISDNWSAYGLSRPDVETIARAVDEFDEAYQAANNPATRNVTSTDRKFARRVNAERLCRLFAQRIKLNHGISNEDKVAIGVPTINNAKSPVECPQTAPALSIAAATPLGHTIGYRDSVNLTPRARPFGSTGLQLFMTVSDENASNPEEARFVGVFTSTPMVVTFDGADRGKQATYFARWCGRKNQVGNWSIPISMTIAA